MLAVLVKTFIREDKLRKCVDNIFRYIDVPFRLYIADDSDQYSKEQAEFYHKLENKGHKIIILPYNTGLPAGRNAMIDALEDEEYVMVLDDDIYVGPDTSIHIPLDIIKKNEEIKLVGGFLPRPHKHGWHLRFHLGESGILYKIPAPEPGEDWHYTNGHRWIDCDDVSNFLVAERGALEKVKWDNRLKMAEHINFFWRFCKEYPDGVAYCPDFVASHSPTNAGIQHTSASDWRGYRQIYHENWSNARWHRFDGLGVKGMMHGVTPRAEIPGIEARAKAGQLKHVKWIDWYE